MPSLNLRQRWEMDWEPKEHPRILASSGMVQPGKNHLLFQGSQGGIRIILTFVLFRAITN